MSGLPDLPAGLHSGLKAYLEALGEQFEVTQADRGSPLRSKPTLQDLVDIGLIRASTLKSNGKTFNLAAKSWIQPNLPSWFTSLLDPPVPTGLFVQMDTANILLSWDIWSSEFYEQTLVYRSLANNLTTAELIGSTTGNTYVDNLPPDGMAYFYWIRNQSKNKRISDFNQVSGTTVGNIAGAPIITYSFSSTNLVLNWPTPTSSLLIKYYIVRYGGTFDSGIPVGVSNTNTLSFPVDFGGTRKFWIAPVDVNNQVGIPGFVNVTVVNPNAPSLLQTVQNDALVITAASTQNSLPISGYEFRYGVSFSGGTLLTTGAATRFEQIVNWTGSRTFWVVAIDSAGNQSVATPSVFTPVLPIVNGVTANVVDNNVLLSWSRTQGSLSIDHYIVDKDGASLGIVYAEFTAIFESVAGTYTYGITAVDSAGNAGLRVITSASVNQPPDFVLYSDVDSTFSGTKTQAIVDSDGGLIINVDNTETWATHFTSRSWNSIADQIAAGYPNYLVGKTTGSYVETIDYGVIVPATKITMTPTLLPISGTMVITPQIETSPNAVSWTAYAGVYSTFGLSFRYVRYTLAFTAAHDGTGLATDTSVLLKVKPLNYRLDVKQKRFSGSVAALSTDAGGTTVNITGLFLDVDSITVSALGTTPLYCVYDFTDTPNPTSFKVLVFNTAGTRVSATVGYSISGV